MCQKNQTKIDGFKTINTFNYLKKASELLLNEARENKKGSAYKYMTSMITSAFFLEAYLNYLGQKIISKEEWERWERKRSRDKLKDLKTKIDCQIDINQRPFKTFQEIFEFRNLMAHAKPQLYSINKEVEREQPTSTQILESEWQSEKPNWKNLINKNNAERFFDDAIQMMEILQAKAGFSEADINLFEWSETRGYSPITQI